MKKTCKIGCFVILFSCNLRAQTQSIEKSASSSSWSNNYKLITIGVGSPAYFGHYKIYNNSSSSTGTISNAATKSVFYVKNEIASGRLGYGISFGRSVMSFDYEDQYFYGANALHLIETVYAFNARFNHHFLKDKIVDPYIGGGIGLKIVNYNIKDIILQTYNKIPIGIEASIGIRYLMSSRIGYYFEFGFGRSLFQGGLTANISDLR